MPETAENRKKANFLPIFAIVNVRIKGVIDGYFVGQ
jgi:hypothetical protein